MKDIHELKLKDVKLFQLLDSDGAAMGIIATPIDSDKMGDLTKEWIQVFNSLLEQGKDPDPTADGFVEYIKSKGLVAGRVFIEDEIVVDI